MKKAFVTGISGFAGSHLAEYLISQNFEVSGVVHSQPHHNNVQSVQEKLTLFTGDLLDFDFTKKVVSEVAPDYIFHLAAFPSPADSFKKPSEFLNNNISAEVNLLEAVRVSEITPKILIVSSAEIYGNAKTLPITELAELSPVSPYAVSKASAFMLTNNYQNAYHLFAVNGVLFNHESYLRTDNFFVKKVITQSLQIKKGKLDFLSVGNVDIKRDFGYAPDYVHAMFLAMNHHEPGNYLVCSGRSISLREIIGHIFRKMDIDMDRMVVDPALYRPSEIEDLFGDNSDTRNTLNWNYDKDFRDILDILIEEEISNSI